MLVKLTGEALAQKSVPATGNKGKVKNACTNFKVLWSKRTQHYIQWVMSLMLENSVCGTCFLSMNLNHAPLCI